MNSTQRIALRDAIHAALVWELPSTPPVAGRSPIPFPKENVVRSDQDHPRDTDFWCTFRETANVSNDAEPSEDSYALQQVWRLSVIAEPGAPVDVDVEPHVEGVDPANVTVAPQGNPTATRDALLALLQAETSPTHPVTYSADNTQSDPAITIAADAALLGIHLFLSTDDPAAIAFALRRDSLAVEARDLAEVTVSIQVSARMLEDNPAWQADPDSFIEVQAMPLLEKLKTRFKTRGVRNDLRAGGLGVLRFNGPRPLTHILGDSQYETRAVLDVTLSTCGVTVDQPGTIEEAVVTGTLQPDNLQIEIDTRS